MRVVRGRVPTPAMDRAITTQIVDSVPESGESALRVWQPPAQVAFGRRDTNRDGFERARELVTDRGVPAIERSTGGHAVYFTGDTLSFLLATPTANERTGIEDRYERTIAPLQSALAALGVDTERGEPDGAFCPGTHSLSAEGKIVGLAQRVRRTVAVVAGIVVLQDHEQIADLLSPVYEALDIPFDPGAVGSISRAGGTTDPETVCETFEAHLTPAEASMEHLSVGADRTVEFS